MSHHKIEASSITFTYPDGHKAIDNITFSIHHGESVGIIGANGAGKSTLLMLLTGILFPGYGRIIIGDIQVKQNSLALIRQRMGMVFQDPDDQLFMPTVFDDVAFGPRNYFLDETEVEKRVIDALDKVGSGHLRDRASFKLSGGEKRSIAIATVLSMQPDILIMDEPSSGLDPKSRRRLIELLKCFDHTKIITSHDLDMIFDLCERVIVMNEGKIAYDGGAKEAMSDKGLMELCGLEVPSCLRACEYCGSYVGQGIDGTVRP